MDGFKTLPKMQHFKTGGHAKVEAMCYGGKPEKKMKKGGEVDGDMKQDKALIKKAFKQHDEAEHDKEPTEIKLKKGGRSKKEEGTVRKYKTGGGVENNYGAKKKSGDLDRIEKTKDIKPGKADASSGAEEMPNKYKKGGKIKKMADGRLTSALVGAGKKLRDNLMGTDAQNAQALADEARYLRAKQLQQAAGKEMGAGEQMAMGLAGLGQQAQPQAQPQATPTVPGQKRGGKAKKMNTGGTAC